MGWRPQALVLRGWKTQVGTLQPAVPHSCPAPDGFGGCVTISTSHGKLDFTSAEMRQNNRRTALRGIPGRHLEFLCGRALSSGPIQIRCQKARVGLFSRKSRASGELTRLPQGRGHLYEAGSAATNPGPVGTPASTGHFFLGTEGKSGCFHFHHRSHCPQLIVSPPFLLGEFKTWVSPPTLLVGR